VIGSRQTTPVLVKLVIQRAGAGSPGCRCRCL